MLWQPPRELREFYMTNRTLGQTARVRDATLAECYFLGRQYDGLPDWGDKSVPLGRRAPRIRLPLFREAVDSLERFIWGGHRFPKAIVGVTRTESDAESADEVGPRLDQDQAAQLTKFVAALVAQGRLQRAVREGARNALVTTSAAIIVGVLGGYLVAQVEAGKHCTPTWDPANPRRVLALEIVYQYEKEIADGAGRTFKKLFWYRRTIDAQNDTVFVEVPVVVGREPEWVVDNEKTQRHALGFCPVVWVRTLPDSTDPIDGRPVIDPSLYPLLEEVDRTLSQRNRAVQYGCDPQVVRKGVTVSEREDLRKNPGQVWDLPKVDSAVELLEAKGTGAEQATAHLDDLTVRFREAVGVVKQSPNVKVGNLSAVALELLHAPMIALAGDLRDDFGTEAYCALLNLALRMVAVVVGRGEDVWIQGAGKAVKMLAEAQLRGVWLDVPIALQWPTYFPPTVQDQQFKVQAANQAVQGGLVNKLTATRYVADVFLIEDAEAERDAIDEEQAEAADYGGMMQRPGAPPPDDGKGEVVQMTADPESPDEKA